jgi:hypothetical protein
MLPWVRGIISSKSRTNFGPSSRKVLAINSLAGWLSAKLIREMACSSGENSAFFGNVITIDL